MSIEPVEASAALVERRLVDAILDDAWDLELLGHLGVSWLRLAEGAVDAILPIIDDLIAERLQAERAAVDQVLTRETRWQQEQAMRASLGGDVQRHRYARDRLIEVHDSIKVLTGRDQIPADHDTGRARLDTRTDRTEERDEHEAAR